MRNREQKGVEGYQLPPLLVRCCLVLVGMVAVASVDLIRARLPALLIFF